MTSQTVTDRANIAIVSTAIQAKLFGVFLTRQHSMLKLDNCITGVMSQRLNLLDQLWKQGLDIKHLTELFICLVVARFQFALTAYTEHSLSILGEMQRTAFRLMLSSSCVCVCVCLSVCVCRVCGPQKNGLRLWRRFCFKLRGITPDISCKSLTQIGLTHSKMADKMVAVKHYNWL